MNARRFGLSLALVVTLLLAACGGSAAPVPSTAAPGSAAQSTEEPPAGQTGQLVVLSWSGYEIPEFWGEFAKKHPNLKPEFAFLSESAESFAKLQSGYPADLVHPCSNYWKLFVDNELVQPIDTSRLSNWKGVRPALAKEGEFNGKQYFIPWDWGFESILIRKDKVKEMPAGWSDLWKKDYAGHISIFDSAESVHVMGAISLGYDPWNMTPEQKAEVKQKLVELKPNILTYWNDATELSQTIASGDVWIAGMAWNATYTSLLNDGVQVEYLKPKEGRMGYLCGFGLSAKSKNVDLAYDFIDAYLAAESGAYLTNEYGYGAANEDALALTKPEMIEALELDDEATLSQTVFYKYLTDELRKEWITEWDEIKAAP